MKFLCLLLIFLTSANLHAFDGKKSGIQLSLGAGVGNLSADFSTSEKFEEKMITYGFKIGYCLGERFTIFLEKESRIYDYQGTDILNEITGIGLKFYLTSRLFLFGAGGIGGFLNEITVIPSDAATGSGYFYGIGFDLFKNISIELSQSSLKVDKTELNEKNIISPTEQTSTNLLLFFNFF